MPRSVLRTRCGEFAGSAGVREDVDRVAGEVTAFDEHGARAEREKRARRVVHRCDVARLAAEQRARFVEIRRDQRCAREQRVAQCSAVAASASASPPLAASTGSTTTGTPGYAASAVRDGMHRFRGNQRADVKRVDVARRAAHRIGRDLRGVDGDRARTCVRVLRGYAGDHAHRAHAVVGKREHRERQARERQRMRRADRRDDRHGAAARPFQRATSSRAAASGSSQISAESTAAIAAPVSADARDRRRARFPPIAAHGQRGRFDDGAHAAQADRLARVVF